MAFISVWNFSSRFLRFNLNASVTSPESGIQESGQRQILVGISQRSRDATRRRRKTCIKEDIFANTEILGKSPLQRGKICQQITMCLLPTSLENLAEFIHIFNPFVTKGVAVW